MITLMELVGSPWVDLFVLRLLGAPLCNSPSGIRGAVGSAFQDKAL